MKKILSALIFLAVTIPNISRADMQGKIPEHKNCDIVTLHKKPFTFDSVLFDEILIKKITMVTLLGGIEWRLLQSYKGKILLMKSLDN